MIMEEGRANTYTYHDSPLQAKAIGHRPAQNTCDRHDSEHSRCSGLKERIDVSNIKAVRIAYILTSQTQGAACPPPIDGNLSQYQASTH